MDRILSLIFVNLGTRHLRNRLSEKLRIFSDSFRFFLLITLSPRNPKKEHHKYSNTMGDQKDLEKNATAESSVSFIKHDHDDFPECSLFCVWEEGTNFLN
jgi:hypothetical protein